MFNLVSGATNKARGLADDFTQLVIAGDTATAYDNFLDPALQEKLSKEDFAAGVQSLELNDTCKPTYNELQVQHRKRHQQQPTSRAHRLRRQEHRLAYRFEGTATQDDQHQAQAQG